MYCGSAERPFDRMFTLSSGDVVLFESVLYDMNHFYKSLHIKPGRRLQALEFSVLKTRLICLF